MEERRRNKRMELQSKIVLKDLNGKGAAEVPIEVNDASRTGIGFFCGQTLEIDTVYEAYLTLWTKEVLHAFFRISRIELMGNGSGYEYGAVFVGMPEIDATKIEIYRIVSESHA